MLPLLSENSMKNFKVSYNSPELFQINENKFVVYDRKLNLRDLKYIEIFSFQK